MRLHRFALLAAAAVLLDGPIRGEDWPEFRGPTGQGLVRDGSLPGAWGPEKNVVWKQAVPGKGWSSPVVQAGRVYLTTAAPAGRDQSLRALCLDAADGKTLWNVEVFRQDGATAPRVHAKNSHASPTPVMDGGRLYVHFGHQGTACLDLAGKVLWRTTSHRYQPVHGNGGTPIVVDDKLVFSADGSDRQSVIALDRSSGKVRWQTDRQTDAVKRFSFSTPLLITANGRRQIISPGSDLVAAYDPDTGKEIWRVRYAGYSIIPRPVYGHGLLFVATGYDSPTVVAIRPDGEGDVTDTHVAWTTRRGAPHAPSPLLVGDELYLVSDAGLASCLDARTGKVHWQQRLGGNFSASPLHAGGRIYFQSEEGVGIVVKAGQQFQELGRNDMEERTLASYAFADGALFLRTEKHLYRFQER